MGNDTLVYMAEIFCLPPSLPPSLPSQREEACGVFSEALAELELSEREASRQREEEEASQQLQETYRVGGPHGWNRVMRGELDLSSLGVCVCAGRLCGWATGCRSV